ncbi:MAG: CBS domain-containing protein [Methanothrix sp.]|jgi:CBS domain-containing protein|uniref:Putative signal-transduction protein with CBS domain n=1 Tax=Methanothrix harundinacea TaxID=301375 RepID=A0A117LG41_9EURY|nr:MAG: Putative signal-transduction protein with CBS domain [Methanothrix harundinacea]KUK96924.1 MAG: Putative signal-transduction protein with CBS domain [Methanothrix harundinacea]MCP1392868.1 CBS domain-containing protein [Methanothrix harundinacea]MDD5768108.1 CBS domain-containing protein [Methanothrix sp.]MDI9399584.1 CBS domain-containing protein [Euryarchaeota archaeon]
METEIPVRDIMARPVITVDSEVDVVKAANKMFSANVGSLIVIHNDQPIGIITERDLVGKIVAKAANPKEITVGDVMSSPLITIPPDVSLSDAAIKMLKSGVKRLPVISGEGKLVGIITDTDLVSGSASIGMGEILSHLIEMHRDSVHFEEQRELIRGICERCGQISDSLEAVNGELLCWSCRDGNK